MQQDVARRSMVERSLGGFGRWMVRPLPQPARSLDPFQRGPLLVSLVVTDSRGAQSQVAQATVVINEVTPSLYTSLAPGGGSSGIVTRFDLASLQATRLATVSGFVSGLACGPDNKLYLALTGYGTTGSNLRQIVCLNLDGSLDKVVLDFATTPVLASSGGPDSPSRSERARNARTYPNFPENLCSEPGVAGSQSRTARARAAMLVMPNAITQCQQPKAV